MQLEFRPSLVRLAPALLALALSPAADATTLNSSFTHLSGNSWSVNLTVLADGLPPSVYAFTSYFSETDYANLEVLASPAAWDSLVVQPDLGIPAAGYLDSQLLIPANGLTAGQSQGGFVVKFNYLGAGAPGSLPFEIRDENFNVLASGQTTVVPEPARWGMSLLGLGVLGFWAARRQRGGAA